MEHERKFLITSIPCHLKQIGDPYLIEQSYVSLHPNEFRIRRRSLLLEPDYFAGINYKAAVKSKGLESRAEIEFHLDIMTYNSLKDELNLVPIRKEYYKFELGDKVLEVSIVDRDLPTTFIYAEVEFDTVEEMNAFIPPSFLGLEVTKDPYWKMSSYWERTRLGGDKNE